MTRDKNHEHPRGSPAALFTEVDTPSKRVFLHQTRKQRLAVLTWLFVRKFLFRPSPRWMHGWRRQLLRGFGARVGPGVRIHPTAMVLMPWNLTLGPRVVIDHRVILDCAGPIEVGQDTRISQYAHLCTPTHDYRRPDMRIVPQPIRLGRRAWLAADSFIGPGVTIGDNVLLGARASAFKDIPPDVVAAGSPAVPIKSRPGVRGGQE